MKIYCTDCKRQLTREDEIVEVEVGFMHDACYYMWLKKQCKKRKIGYERAIKKVKSMLKISV